MTIIGQAEIDIRAIGRQFQADINRTVTPGLVSAGKEADKTARGMRSSFGAVWTAFGAQSQGALGPVAMVVGQLQTAVESIQKNSSLAAKGMVAGGIGAGVGIGLQALGSGELAAQQQLQMSIENLGHTYDEYGSQVEKTVKIGERHGHTEEETLRVLNQLTIATRSPTKALQDYSVVLDMAAVRHVPLQTAARMLSMVYAGNSRALKTFGIDLTQGTKALAAQKKATDEHTSAQERLRKARQNLADTEARINASRQGHKATQDQLASATARVASAEASVAVARFKHGYASPQAAAAAARLAAAEEHLTKVRAAGNGTTALTVSQQIELRKAHEALTQAENDVKKSATDMASAHQAAAGAITSADGAVKLLSERVKGQADPAMNTFSGHLHAYWATAEDDLAHFGNRWGGTVTAISTGVLATSTIVEAGSAMWRHFSSAASTATTTVEDDLQQMNASGSMSLGKLGGAVAGVAAAIGSFELGRATAGHGAGGAVVGTLGGAVMGAVAGLAIGGPFGAAIGGAGGALIGLAGHFMGVSHAVQDTTTSLQVMTTTLAQALQLDKGKLGNNAQQWLQNYLQQNPTITAELARNKVSASSIVQYLQGGVMANVPNGLAQSGASTDMMQKIMSAYLSARSQYNAYEQVVAPPAAPGPSGQLTSIHHTLLAIQHNTAKGAQHTKDLQTTVQLSRPAGRSPELATL